MKKILFLDEVTKREVETVVNKQLKVKNHLKAMLYTNNNHKLSNKELNALHIKYEEQIHILEGIKTTLSKGVSRKDIQEINKLIDQLNSNDK